jgi:hypothetical protein
MAGNRNPLFSLLSEGDLTSDGLSDEVVSLVSSNIHLLPELVECLNDPNDALRGHAADTLEKLARSHPEELVVYLPALIRAATHDKVPMVRWHMAMALGHLSIFSEHAPQLAETLFVLLRDGTPATKCWTIVSLCVLARQYPEMTEDILHEVSPLQRSISTALRSKVKQAMQLLTDPASSFPKGWIKSDRLQTIDAPGGSDVRVARIYNPRRADQ